MSQPVDHRALAALAAAPLLERLGTAVQGLTSPEADRRLAEVGPNDPAPPRRGIALAELLGFLTNPLVLILLLASLLSAALGDVPNAEIIALIVLLSVALNFSQAYRSQRAAKRLRQEVAPTASVRRDGRWVDMPRRRLVPGDVIRLAAGDRTPADVRLLETRDLHVQQAALTGESMPVEKEAADQPPGPGPIAEARQLAFLGTSVVSGTATAVVIASGRPTAFGDIADLL
jgi:Mg2+-importing ATPase